MGEVAKSAVSILPKPLRKIVGGLGHAPSPPGAPPPPSAETPAVQQAVSEAAQRRSRSRGYRSTILSQQFMAPDAAALKTTLGS